MGGAINYLCFRVGFIKIAIIVAGLKIPAILREQQKANKLLAKMARAGSS